MLKHTTIISRTAQEEAEIKPPDNSKGTPEQENHKQKISNDTLTQPIKDDVDNYNKNDEVDTE